MEELRSTEILDKEIEADARKKAEKILARADEECRAILEDVARRVDDASQQKKAHYDERLAQLEKSIGEALPLEKERFLVAFYNDSVSAALNSYLEGLGAEKRLSLLESRLASLPENIRAGRLSALVFGFDVGAARRMLEKSLRNLTEVGETTFGQSGEEAAPGNSFHEGIILETEDKFTRVRLTVDQIVREIKDTYSAELAESLFGGRLPA